MATTKVSFRFSQPNDPNAKNPSWSTAEVGFEFDSVTQAEADLSNDVDTLRALAMIGVFEALGVEYVLNPENGVPEPVIAVSTVPAAAPRRAASQPPAFDVNGLPTITVDGVTYHDYRDPKAQKLVKDRFPDFKSIDGKKSEWLVGKDDKPTVFAQKLAGAGLL